VGGSQDWEEKSEGSEEEDDDEEEIGIFCLLYMMVRDDVAHHLIFVFYINFNFLSKLF
jgi:hypothetical protein